MQDEEVFREYIEEQARNEEEYSLIHGEPAEPLDQSTHVDIAVVGEQEPGDQPTNEDVAAVDEAIDDEALDNGKGKVVDDTLEQNNQLRKETSKSGRNKHM
ncbi:hypothetical protein Tco_0229888 [Tanacetum coccineum]